MSITYEYKAIWMKVDYFFKFDWNQFLILFIIYVIL